MEDSESTRHFYDKYILGTKDHFEMIQIIAEEEGMNVIEYLKQLEQLACDAAYWGLGSWASAASATGSTRKRPSGPFKEGTR